MTLRAAAAGAAVLLLGGCTSGTIVTRGGGEPVQAAMSEPALGGRYRIMVAAVVDKTDPAKQESFAQQLDAVNTANADSATRLTSDGILHGIRDMLVTDLFAQDRFIVLERAALDEVLTEQEFSQSARVGDATRIPPKQLEGAELIVLCAVTAFDTGSSGGALPIPVPLGDRGDFGVLHLRFKRGYVAMDMRVVDARTGRILSSVAVNGRNSRFGVNFNVHLAGPHHRVDLPNVLTWFQNTPVEAALQEMVTAAVDHIAERVPAAPAPAPAPLN